MMHIDSTNDAVAGLLRQLGYNEFTWDGSPLTLEFEQSGKLHIELNDRGLLLARTQYVNEYDILDRVPKALRSVHLDQQLPSVVQTGMTGENQLAFVTTISERELTLSRLNEAMMLINYLHQQLAE